MLGQCLLSTVEFRASQGGGLRAEPSAHIHQVRLGGDGTGSDSRTVADLLPGRPPQNHTLPGIKQPSQTGPPKFRSAKQLHRETTPSKQIAATQQPTFTRRCVRTTITPNHTPHPRLSASN